MENQEEILVKVIRRIDENRRICLPKEVDDYGKDFFVIFFKDHIRLIPKIQIKED